VLIHATTWMNLENVQSERKKPATKTKNFCKSIYVK
jgi:hypothetical protein